MRKIILLCILCAALTGCADSENNTELIRFRDDVQIFCENIKTIDTSINSITNITMDEPGIKQATTELLSNLDILKDEFDKFSTIDFPEEFDYLEQLADEAADYMTEAVNAYTKTYTENYTSSMEDYALENYKRAYKRIRVIIDVLNGEEVTD